MNSKTLREMCESQHVSRRAVQGYEKYGLVSATGKTGRGYLLYDEAAQARVRRIKLYQEYGFSLKEIAGMLQMDGEALSGCLREKEKELLKKKEALAELIAEIAREIKELEKQKG